MESSGDRDLVTELARFGSIGIFTVEVDRAVLDGRADVGVHSLKDMTTTLQDGVVLAGVLERGMIEYALVARDGLTLDGLPSGARIGTGSLRRGAMLRAARPDLEVVPIRGNVGTRLSKVTGGELDATVLARAGLVRLGLEEHASDLLDTQRFLPAVGQGIVGLTCRADDLETRERLEREARDPRAWASALAERVPARHEGRLQRAGRRARHRRRGAPLPGGARPQRRRHPDGRGRRRGRLRRGRGPGLQLAEELAARGGRDLVEEARAQADG